MQKFNCVLSLFLILIFYSTARAVPLRYRRAFSYIANETACTVDHIVYKDGDPIPTDDPCESCKCRPPGFSCVLRECEVKTGCKAIRRAGECCPQYQCGCEHNGNYYGDGDRIPNAESPCYSCYCQGSSITCSLADCKFRFDCEPEYVLGECCPRYDHCPPENIPSVTVKSTIVPILTTLFTKTTPMPTTVPTAPSITTPTTTSAPTTTPVPTTTAAPTTSPVPKTTTTAPITTTSVPTTTTPLTTTSSPSVETVPTTLPAIVKEVTTTQSTSVSSEVETLAPTETSEPIRDSSVENPTSEQTSPPITESSSESSSTEYSTVNPSKELSETKATTESTTIAQTISSSELITELNPTTAASVEDINKQNITDEKGLTTSLSVETTTATNLMTTIKTISDITVSSPKSTEETIINTSTEYPKDKTTVISEEIPSSESTEKSKEPEESSTQIPITTTIDGIDKKKIESQDSATESTTQKELIPTELTTISSDSSETTTTKPIDDSKIEITTTAKEESQTEPEIKAVTTEPTKLSTTEAVGPQDVVSEESSETLTEVPETVTQSIGMTTVTAKDKEVVTEIPDSVTVITTEKSDKTPEQSEAITTQSPISGEPTQTISPVEKTVTEVDITTKTVELEVTTIQTQTERPSDVTQSVTDVPNPKMTEQTDKIPEISSETTETSKIVETEVTTMKVDSAVTVRVPEISEPIETVTESPTEKSVDKVSEVSSDLTTVLSVEETKADVSTDSKVTPTEPTIEYSTKQSATDSVTTVKSLIEALNTESDVMLEVITTTKPEIISLNSNESKPISDQKELDITSSPLLDVTTTESSKTSPESISRDLTTGSPKNEPQDEEVLTLLPSLGTLPPDIFSPVPSSGSIEDKKITVTDKDSTNSEELKIEEIATTVTTISNLITVSEENKETVTTVPLIIETESPELTTTLPIGNSSSLIGIKEDTITSLAIDKIETTTKVSEELSATSHRTEDIKTETTDESVETSSPKLMPSPELTTQKELAQELPETTTTGSKELNGIF